MNRKLTLISIFFTVTKLCAGSDPELRVFVYDRASTPPLLLNEALDRAARVLATAGVKSSWKVCPPGSGVPGGRQCTNIGNLTILLRLLPSAEAKRWPMERNSCGMALTGGPGAYGLLALVDADCIRRKGGSSPAAQAGLIAHVFAHEIGHLLLGFESHSSSGLMSSQWTIAETALLARAQLKFTSAETARLRQAMLARATTAMN